MAAAACTDGLETDLRHAAMEDLTGLLCGQGYEVAVDALHLTVCGGQQLELRARCWPGNSFRLWFAWPAKVWTCPAGRLQDAVVQVEQVLRCIPARGA